MKLKKIIFGLIFSISFMFCILFVSMNNSKVYAEDTETVTTGDVDLSALTGDYVAKNDDVLTGTIAGNYKISVTSGATITLKDATITGSGSWSGITCLGDATIIITGKNVVNAFGGNYAAINIPSKKTITLKGDGELSASSKNTGAAIGGNSDSACGNIKIESGTYRLSGGQYGACIGSGKADNKAASCGNITINGGTIITNYRGSNPGAAIGSGGTQAPAYKPSCGSITINGGIITAYGGFLSAGIGAGIYGTCGNIAINGGIIKAYGGSEGAGIGTGRSNKTGCGTITISDKVTYLLSKKGSDSPHSLGSGTQGNCGKITVAGEELSSVSDDTYIYSTIKVEDVNNLINEIGTVEYTQESKDKIDKARMYYDFLTDDDKKKINNTTLKKLTDAEEAYTDFEDEIKANEVVELINNIDLTNITLEDKTTIEGVRSKYKALTENQKKKVSQETLDKLVKAESILEVRKLEDEINKLPNEDDVSLGDKTKVEAVVKKYKALSEDQKSYIDSDVAQKYTEVVDKYDTLVANDVATVIDDLPEITEITIDDKASIDAAAKKYNALNEDQKNKVPQETVEKLDAAKKEIADIVAAKGATDAINLVPALEDITFNDKSKIDNASKKYNALTDDQKQKVSQELVDKLEAAQAKIEEIVLIKGVTDAINSIPALDKITFNDKAKIDTAAQKYDALTTEQKAQIPNETIEKLEAAKKLIAEIVAIKDTTDSINALPNVDDISLENKEVFENAIKNFEALTDEEKEQLGTDLVNKYNEVISEYKKIAEVDDAINNLPESTEVTKDDIEVVEQARILLNSLNDEEKTKISQEDLDKLSELEEIVTIFKFELFVDELGEITYSADCKTKLDEALAKYDALTPEQKELATESYEKLQALLKTYEQKEIDATRHSLIDNKTNLSIETSTATGIPKNVNLVVSVLADTEKVKTSSNYNDILTKISGVGTAQSIYAVKLIQVVDGVEKEVQPSEIKDGMKLIIKFVVPEGINAQTAKILHVHSNKNMEFVENVKVENNQFVFEVSSLSEFVIVTPNTFNFCIGWVSFILVMLNVLFMILFLIVRLPITRKLALKMKLEKLVNKNLLVNIIGLLISALVLGFGMVTLAIDGCTISIVSYSLSMACVLVFTLFIILELRSLIKKNNK